MVYDEPTFRRHGSKESADGATASPTRGLTTGDPAGHRRDDPQHEQPRRPLDLGDSSAPVLSSGSLTGSDLRGSGSTTLDRTDDPLATDDDDRDRLKIHFGLEGVLLLALAAVAYLLYRLDSASLGRPALGALLVSATAIGLLTLGAGLSLRAGVPNLAIGPIAVASALHFAENGDLGVVTAALPAIGIAAAGGLLVAGIVVALHVPGWAATLAGAMVVIVFNELRNAPVEVQGGFDPSNKAFLLFGGFALLALLGGGLGTVAFVRRILGWARTAGDPAVRPSLINAVPVVVALIASSALAVLAGVIMAASSATAIKPGTGLEWTGLGIGLAMVAGTSIFGRRGGVFGTLLAATGMAFFLDYADRRNFSISLFAIAAAAVAAGLVFSRLIETYSSPLSQAGEDRESRKPESWSPAPPSTWTQTVPAQPTPDRWLDDRWGQTPR